MNLQDIKIMLVKGQKGDKGDGSYDDTELRQMIADEALAREAEIAQLERDWLNYMYPVGSIYISVNSTSPQTLFGGIWEQIQGKFLLASSSSHTAGSTGGAETHKLTYQETPYHEHSYAQFDDNDMNWVNESILTAYPTSTSTRCGFVNVKNHTSGSSETANQPMPTSFPIYDMNETKPPITSESATQAFSTMPPYLSVYVWKRTD